MKPVVSGAHRDKDVYSLAILLREACRSDLQKRVLEVFSVFLPVGGYLVLGTAETMPGTKIIQEEGKMR